MMERVKVKTKRFKKLVKVLFVVVYPLVGAEFFLRLFAPVPMLPRYVCTGPYGVRANEANRQYWHKTPEYRIQVRTNSKGIRADREIPYAKPAGVKRIVLLGDSFGMGYGVDYEDMFTRWIERALAEKGIQSEVVNLSVSGFGSAEELILLREEGFRYEPDLVLVAFHATDYNDNVRSNLFVLKDGGLERNARTYLPGVKIREFLFRFSAYRWLAGDSHLYNFLRGQAAGWVKNVLVTLRSKPAEAKEEIPKPQGADYAHVLTYTLLDEIRRESAAHGAGFLILDVPVRQSRCAFHSVLDLEGIGPSEPFSVFSPIERFKEYQGQMLYWERSHGHFTPLGCRAVGKGLAEMIFEDRLLGAFTTEFGDEIIK